MNILRFTLTVVLAFAFVFGFEYAWHSHLLMGHYEATKDVWRTEEAMQELCYWAFAAKFLMVVIITYLFTRKHENKGILEGIRFGLLIGLLLGVIGFSSYSYLPIPLILAGFWFLGGLLEGLGIGIICSLFYKSK